MLATPNHSFVVSTVSVRTLTKKLIKQSSGVCFFLSIFNLLGCTLRPRNTFKGGFTYGK